MTEGQSWKQWGNWEKATEDWRQFQLERLALAFAVPEDLLRLTLAARRATAAVDELQLVYAAAPRWRAWWAVATLVVIMVAIIVLVSA